MKRKTILIGGAILVVLLGAFFSMRHFRSGEHETTRGAVIERLAVEAAPAVRRRVATYSDVPATVEALQKAELAAKIMGRVTSVSVKEGDRIRKGQVLVTIEAADLAAGVRQAQAQWESASAGLSQARTGASIQRVQSRTRIEQARSELVFAREQLSLVKEGPRRQQKSEADEQVRIAEEAVHSAKEQLSLVNEGPRRQQKSEADEQVRIADEAVRSAKEQLSLVKEGPRRQQKTQADHAVARARSALAAAKAQLSLLQEGARSQQKAQANQQVLQAQAAYRNANANFVRFKYLYEVGAVSPAQFDDAKMQSEVAESALEAAKQQASLVHEGARTQEVMAAEESVRQAQASVQMAMEQRDLMYEGARAQEIRQAEAAVRQAESQHAIAVQRREMTWDGSRVQEVRKAEDAVRQAEGALAIARQRREMTREGSRAQELRQAEARVRQAEQALQMAVAASAETAIKEESVKYMAAQARVAEAGRSAAGVALGYAVIVAPFDGVVTAKRVDPGAMAAPGVPLIAVEDHSRYLIAATVPESKVPALTPGLRLPAESGPREHALMADVTVTRIVPSADPGSRTFTVKADLAPSAGLLPGMFARLKVPVGTHDALLIPRGALWERDGITGVFVADRKEGLARMRVIQAGAAHPGSVEVLSGLSEGELVIVGNLARLRDAAPVRVTRLRAGAGGRAGDGRPRESDAGAMRGGR